MKLAVLYEDYKRNELPQIPQKDIKPFLTSLDRSMIAWIPKEVSISTLKPTQSELNPDKIKEHKQRSLQDLSKDTWLVSKEYSLLDGHHRWAALKELSPDYKVKVVVINLPIKQLISLGHNYLGSFTKEIDQ